MRLTVEDIQELTPVIRAVVAACLEELRTEDQTLAGQLGYTEAQAAAQLGVAAHALRDCRYRGEISGSRVGRSICYSRSELLAFLRRRAVS
jgi:hypothetical protein